MANQRQNGSDNPVPSVRYLVEKLGVRSGTALDIYCGSGRNALFLAKNHLHVTALDADADRLDALRSTAVRNDLMDFLQPFLYDVHADSLPAVTYSIVLLTYCLHKFSLSTAGHLLYAALKCVAEDGYMVIEGFDSHGAIHDHAQSHHNGDRLLLEATNIQNRLHGFAELHHASHTVNTGLKSSTGQPLMNGAQWWIFRRSA